MAPIKKATDGELVGGFSEAAFRMLCRAALKA
jgi:hypothetical protein